jgi:hypothetical protein
MNVIGRCPFVPAVCTYLLRRRISRCRNIRWTPEILAKRADHVVLAAMMEIGRVMIFDECVVQNCDFDRKYMRTTPPGLDTHVCDMVDDIVSVVTRKDRHEGAAGIHHMCPVGYLPYRKGVTRLSSSCIVQVQCVQYMQCGWARPQCRVRPQLQCEHMHYLPSHGCENGVIATGHHPHLGRYMNTCTC